MLLLSFQHVRSPRAKTPRLWGDRSPCPGQAHAETPRRSSTSHSTQRPHESAPASGAVRRKTARGPGEARAGGSGRMGRWPLLPACLLPGAGATCLPRVCSLPPCPPRSTASAPASATAGGASDVYGLGRGAAGPDRLPRPGQSES